MYLLLSCAFTLLLAGDPDRFVAVPFSKVPFEVPFAPEPGFSCQHVWHLP